MTESMSFKVYLKRDWQNVEVRRFIVDSDVAGSIFYLENKIRAVFPSIKNDPFNMYWQDNEDDYVILGSDEELKVAIISANVQPFKLFINISETTEQHESDGGAQIHAHVLCDSCDGPVTGFRYKCITCVNFDLCSTCEGAGKHPEHFMLRMPTPDLQHPKFVRKLFGRSHKMFKSGKHYTHDVGGSSRKRGCRFSRPEGIGSQTYGDMFDFSGLMDFVNTMAGPCEAGERQPEANEPNARAQTSTNSQATPGQHAGAQNNRPSQPTGINYLNGIGQAITAILDPFGIDVTFDVKTQSSSNGGPQQCGPTTESNRTGNDSTSETSQSSTPMTTEDTPSQQSVKPIVRAPLLNVEPVATTSTVNDGYRVSAIPPTVMATEGKSTDTSPEVRQANSPVASARRNSDDWTLINRESPTRSEVAMDVEGASGSNPEPTSAPTEATSAPTEATSAPTEAASAPILDPDRQVIEAAINNIRSMGFNLELKLLRELLMQQNGDVAAVLETILNLGKK